MRGIIYDPDETPVIECYIDADFPGGRERYKRPFAENFLSISSYFITYAGCPVLWDRKIYIEIALITEKAEYISLSTELREVIMFLYILHELLGVFKLHIPTPRMEWKIYYYI